MEQKVLLKFDDATKNKTITFSGHINKENILRYCVGNFHNVGDAFHEEFQECIEIEFVNEKTEKNEANTNS